MLIDVALLAVALVLAGGAYFFKRHGGTLLLLVMAGGLFAGVATPSVVRWCTDHGFTLGAVPLEGAIAVALILLPSVLGWFIVPKSHVKLRRIVGVLLFGAVAATLVSKYASVIFDANLVAQSKSVSILAANQTYIIALGLLFALLDLFLGKGRNKEESKKK